MMNLKNTVGLFGTCGDSKWRDPVIAKLSALGIDTFNPVVPNWTPECAAVEAEHLATDRVLLFAITGETGGFGSLAETGWAALSALRNGQIVVFYIQDTDDGPKSDANRARKLVKAHAAKAGFKIHTDLDAAIDDVITGINS